MKKLQFKSIRTRFLSFLILATVLVLTTTGFVLGFLSREETHKLTVNLSNEVVNAGRMVVEEWLDGIINEMEVLAQTTDIRGNEPESYKKLFNEVITESDGLYDVMFLSDLEGNSINNNGVAANLKGREYVMDIISGKPFSISNALLSKDSGKPAFVIAVPIMIKGKLSGLIGAVITLNVLSDKLSRMKIGESGSLFLVDGTGITVAHPMEELIMKFSPVESEKDGYKGLSEMGREMMNGKNGNGSFTRPDGSQFTCFYGAVANTPNWSVGAIIPNSQINETSNLLIQIILIAFAIITVVIILITFITGNSVTTPVKELAKVLQKLSDLDLRFDETSKAVKYMENKDEIGQMTRNLAGMESNIRDLVKTITQQSEEISNSATSLSSVSQEQLASSEELASQARNVDENSQNTSASIQEVTSGIEEVAASAGDVSKNSQELATKIAETEESVNTGITLLGQQGKMMKTVGVQNNLATQLVTTVAEKSNNVQGIVKTISSIAEQTNLLALNAAIEAARAGDAGKGFAVVADEIRKLAEDSKTASANIATILNEIDDESDKANEAVKKTVELYDELNESSQQIFNEFDRIKNHVETVNIGVETLMSVAEEQSASAEEMASAMDSSARSTSEISEQVEQMSKGVEQQTIGAQQVSSAAEQLNALSEKLDAEIKKFII